MNDVSLAAYVEREHEYRFVAVQAEPLPGAPPFPTDVPDLGVVCARYSDAEYKATRCPPAEFERRYGQYGIDRVWRDDVLPCRVYARHCVLASQKLGPGLAASFLDQVHWTLVSL